MAQLLDRAAGYSAALHDLGASLEVVADAQRHGIRCDYELLLRSELTRRWHERIDRVELPPSFDPQLTIAVAAAGSSVLIETAPQEADTHAA